MDADIFAVYKRLSDSLKSVDYSDYNFKFIHYSLSPDLCTAEMTTFLKETTNGTAT